MSRRPGRRPRTGPPAMRTVAAAVLVAALAAACALPVDREPRVVPVEQVPFDLSGAAQVDAPVFDRSLELAPVTVYLASVTESGDRILVPRQRMIADPINLATVVGNLMAGGVTPDERDHGLINQVPGRELRSVERGAGTPGGVRSLVTIEVQPQFFDRFPTTEAQRVAIGQIVLTVTGYRAAGGEGAAEQVRFTVGGRVRPVPTADAADPILPVVAARHYRALQNAPTGRAGT